MSGATAGAGAPRRSLVLIGFMGAGKSRTARTVAEALGTQAIDCDELLERELQNDLESFFAQQGEPAFREAEERVVGELLERADGEVIALGGGSLGSARVRDALERHVAVLLDVDPEVAWRRSAGGDRPLVRDRDSFFALHAQRREVYERAADAILPRGGLAMVRALPALELLRAGAPSGLRMLWATAASGEYPVFVGDGAVGLLATGAELPGLGGRRFVVSDANVAPLYAGRLGESAASVTIPAGERSKTLAEAERVWRALATAGMTRSDHLVALGGGVVGDLAGFCAATYQRGVAVVGVPTTLVAQVDAAYGGKAGVDLPEAKNYVGAYHQPAAVLVDPGVLDTLPAAERAAGHAEVIKTALIAGGELWRHVREGAPGDVETILACARTKLAIVAADERDAGARQSLNLGHTVGHAIEAATGYERYRHGEAVGLGLLAALRLSGLDDLRTEVAGLLARAGLPTRLDGADPAEVVARTERDKKRVGDAPVRFVLLDAPGEVRTGCAVDAADVRAAVTELAA